MRRSTRHRMALLAVLLLPVGALSQTDGHGPDAWRVTGVASNDRLNMRSGPGTDHLVIGAFADNATGLRLITCVPFLPEPAYRDLTEAERADLLYDAQDFRGELIRIAPDPDRPMYRGTITINVDVTNWGRQQRAVFRLRADTARPEAPIRIFRLEHRDRAFP